MTYAKAKLVANSPGTYALADARLAMATLLANLDASDEDIADAATIQAYVDGLRLARALRPEHNGL